MNEKIICLVRSCMDQFVICGDHVKLTSEGTAVQKLMEVPVKKPERAETQQTGPALLSAITGNITGKIQANCAFISRNIGGNTESVFFEKKAYIGSMSNPKLPLHEIVVAGERVCFDATLGPPGASCKYKATRVWKADMLGQVFFVFKGTHTVYFSFYILNQSLGDLQVIYIV